MEFNLPDDDNLDEDYTFFSDNQEIFEIKKNLYNELIFTKEELKNIVFGLNCTIDDSLNRFIELEEIVDKIVVYLDSQES